MLVYILKHQEGRKYSVLGFPNSISRRSLHMNMPVFCRTQFGKCSPLSRIIFRERGWSLNSHMKAVTLYGDSQKLSSNCCRRSGLFRNDGWVRRLYGHSKLHFWRNGINFIEVYLFFPISSVKNPVSGKLYWTPKLALPLLVSNVVMRKRLPSQGCISQLLVSMCGHVTSFTNGMRAERMCAILGQGF